MTIDGMLLRKEERLRCEVAPMTKASGHCEEGVLCPTWQSVYSDEEKYSLYKSIQSGFMELRRSIFR
jgi:hypothetical protein